MNRLIAIVMVVIAIFVSACSPQGSTKEQLQATSDAAVANAVVSTLAAQPTAADTATPSTTPTATPISTLKPTATLEVSSLIRNLNSALARIPDKITVVDARYEDGAQGMRTILHIDFKSTSDTFNYSSSGSVVGALAATIHSSYKFEAGLVAVNIIGYDSKLNAKQTVVGLWQDFYDYAENKITSEQFILRLMITPSLSSK